MPYLFLFAGMLCFGWSNCLWRPMQEGSTAIRLIFLRCLWTVPLIALAGLLIGGGWVAESIRQALESIPYILISLAGLWCFVRSTHYQPAGLSGSLILYMGFFGSLVAWLFAEDELPVNFAVTVVLYLGGLFLISPGKFRNDTPLRGTALALLAAICWAFANLGLKEGIKNAGVWSISLIQEGTVLVVAGIINLDSLKNRNEKTTFKVMDMHNLLPLSLLTVGGVVFSNISLGEIPVLHFALITMVQPVTTLFISALVYRENIGLHQWLGGLMLMVGSVWCAIG